jgi:hypothetical protein
MTMNDNLDNQHASSGLDPEELKHIHEVFNEDSALPHEDDEVQEETGGELSRNEVKHHTDNALEDETNSSLYEGQHLPE